MTVFSGFSLCIEGLLCRAPQLRLKIDIRPSSINRLANPVATKIGAVMSNGLDGGRRPSRGDRESREGVSVEVEEMLTRSCAPAPP